MVNLRHILSFGLLLTACAEQNPQLQATIEKALQASREVTDRAQMVCTTATPIIVGAVIDRNAFCSLSKDYMNQLPPDFARGVTLLCTDPAGQLDFAGAVNTLNMACHTLDALGER